MSYAKTSTKCLLCERIVYARGLCTRHYSSETTAGRIQRYKKLSQADYFWRHVKKTEKCWLWTGWTTTFGYGEMQKSTGTKIRAHRFSYELHKGPIPKGLIVMHLCDNPPCVNPRHLRVGTVSENSKDEITKGRNPWGEQHGMAKLSDDDVRAIRTASLGGERQSSIARRFKIHQSTVSQIVANKRRQRPTKQLNSPPSFHDIRRRKPVYALCSGNDAKER